MASETINIAPKLDPQALRRLESTLEDAFSEGGRALSSLKKSTNDFWKTAEKAGDVFEKKKRGPQEWVKALDKAQRHQKTLEKHLRTAEATFGKSSKVVEGMRREFERSAKLTSEIEKNSAGARRQIERQTKAQKSAPRGGGGGGGGGGMGLAAGLGAGIAIKGVQALGAALGKTRDVLADVRGEMDAAAKSTAFSVQEYGRLKFAAERSGTSIGALENASLKLNTNLAQGSKRSADALKSLGLSASDLKKLAPEDQFKAISDQLSGVENKTKRTQIEMALFGKAGAELDPLLKGGGEAIDALGDKAESLGRVYDEDAAHAAERFGDAQDNLKDAVMGVASQVAQSFMPMLAGAAEGMVDLIGDNKELIDGVISGITDVAQGIMGVMGEIWEFLQPHLETLWPKILEFAGKLWDSWSNLKEPIFELAEAVFEFIDPLLEMADMLLPIFETIAVQGFGAIKEVVNELTDLASGLVDVFKSFADGNIKDGFIKLGRAILDGLLAPLRIIAGQLVDLADALGASGVVPDSVRAFARRTAMGSVLEILENASKGPEDASDEAPIQIGDAPSGKGKGKGKGTGETEDPPDKKGKGKDRRSARVKKIDADIDKLAEAAAEREFQRVIRSGGSVEEADAAAEEVRKKSKADLSARRDELVRQGTVGGLGGTAPTIPGLSPSGESAAVRLDVGGSGGPPPVQIVNFLPHGRIEIDIITDATDAQGIASEIAGPGSAAILEMLTNAIPNIDSGVRR